MTARQIEDQADAVIARLNHERRGRIRAMAARGEIRAAAAMPTVRTGAARAALADLGTGWFSFAADKRASRSCRPLRRVPPRPMTGGPGFSGIARQSCSGAETSPGCDP
jgi:hypothetical protein